MATKIVTLTAVGCSTDSECGGTYFPSSGATFCGPSGAALYTKRMKYQVGAVCYSGACKESTEPGVLEDCGVSGKICGFSKENGGQFQCVASPGVSCAPNAAITSSCICGLGSYEQYGNCCLNSNGSLYHSVSSCPILTPTPTFTPTPIPTPASTGSVSFSPVDPFQISALANMLDAVKSILQMLNNLLQ
mgnify:CR=1 FL=1